MVFPRDLEARGTGLPDFQTAVQSVTGTIAVVGSVRAIGSLQFVSVIGTLRRTGYVARLGTIRRVGTVRYLQAGSLGYVKRVGTIAQVGSIARVESIGTVRIIVAGQDVVTAVDVQARLRSGTAMRDRIPLGPGSSWMGSWQDVANYFTKTYAVRAAGSAAYFSIITGMMGSGVGGATGTFLGSVRIGVGSYKSYNFTEAFQFTRPHLKAVGANQEVRGSFSVMFARQT